MTERAADHPDLVADHVMSALTPAAGYDDDVAVLIYRHPPAPLAVQVSADDPKAVAIDWAAALAESSKGSAPA